MEYPDVLDRIAASGEAVFAIDRTDRIVYWSKACESILGHRAEDVLGRMCFEVVSGRDVHGNIHCYRNCPVMYQGRTDPGDPVRGFTLQVRTRLGEEREIQVGTFVLRDVRPSLSTIVHIVRNGGLPTPLERRLREEVAGSVASGWDTGEVEERLADLTGREMEVLHHLARGASTTRVAEEMGISPVTVRNHVQKVLEKLGVHTKMAAVAYAYRYGIVSGDSGDAPN